MSKTLHALCAIWRVRAALVSVIVRALTRYWAWLMVQDGGGSAPQGPTAEGVGLCRRQDL